MYNFCHSEISPCAIVMLIHMKYVPICATIENSCADTKIQDCYFSLQKLQKQRHYRNEYNWLGILKIFFFYYFLWKTAVFFPLILTLSMFTSIAMQTFWPKSMFNQLSGTYTNLFLHHLFFHFHQLFCYHKQKTHFFAEISTRNCCLTHISHPGCCSVNLV